MGGVRGEHRGFACAGAVHDEAAPALREHGLHEAVTLFLPVVDAAPVHDERRGPPGGQAQVADDLLVAQGQGDAFQRGIEVAGGGEVVVDGLAVGLLLAGRAGEGMARGAVPGGGLEVGRLGLVGVSLFFGFLGGILPARPGLAPGLGPGVGVHAGQFRQGAFCFGRVHEVEWAALAHALADAVLDFVQSCGFRHDDGSSVLLRSVENITDS